MARRVPSARALTNPNVTRMHSSNAWLMRISTSAPSRVFSSAWWAKSAAMSREDAGGPRAAGTGPRWTKLICSSCNSRGGSRGVELITLPTPALIATVATVRSYLLPVGRVATNPPLIPSRLMSTSVVSTRIPITINRVTLPAPAAAAVGADIIGTSHLRAYARVPLGRHTQSMLLLLM